MTAHASFDAMWSDLEAVGKARSGGYRRYAWTREDHTLREWFAGECAKRGLDLSEDRVGNQWAWWGDPDAAVSAGRPGVAIGSHLDSVPDGGAYDGPLGVVSAFAVVDALRAAGRQPTVPLAVVNFIDEEGARFGVACAGSRVLTGAMTAQRALALTDADGLSMAQALKAAGRDPQLFGADPEALRRVGSFVELHVEQGRGLVDVNQAVGLASDIWPHGRWRMDLPGVANHAGTTGMSDRRDAVISLAQVAIRARDLALQHGCVATVGKARIEPGGVNAIASHVTAWLDARGSQAGAVNDVVVDLTRTVQDLGGQIGQESWTPATPFDPTLTQRLGQIIGRTATVSVPVLGTGAGHDAGILASVGVPSAMMFVRNPTGISHSPAEFAEPEDCHAGVAALAACIADLTGAAPGGGPTLHDGESL